MNWSQALATIKENQTDMRELISNWSDMLDSTPADVIFEMFDGTVYTIPNFAKIASAIACGDVDNDTTLYGGAGNLKDVLENLQASEIGNDSSLSGATVKDALNSIGSDNITNNSTVVGSAVSDALETNDAAITANSGRLDTIENSVTELTGTLKLYGFSSDLSVPFSGYQKTYYGATKTIVIVEIWLTQTYNTSTTTTLGFTSADIPAALRPDVDSRCEILCYNNLTTPPLVSVIGEVVLTTTGDWVINRTDTGTFDATNSKGIPAQLIRYRKSIT